MTNPPHPGQPAFPPDHGPAGGYTGHGGNADPDGHTGRPGPGGPGAQGGIPSPRRPPYGPPPQRPPADDVGVPPGYAGNLPGPDRGAAPQAGPPGAQQGGYSHKSFLGALFDLSFDHMVTIRLIRLSYLLVLVVTGVSALAMLLLAWSFSEWNGMLATLTILAIPVVSLFQIVVTRMFLEFLINQFKITEELRKIRESGGTR